VPELPEVETIVRGLAPWVVGRCVVAVDVRERRLRSPVDPRFAAALAGRRVTSLGRAGKTIVAALDDGRCWLTHLGMTGRLTLQQRSGPGRLHDHVRVDFEDGSSLVYNDVRRFGRLLVVPAAAVASEVGRGLEPLAPTTDADALRHRARRRRLAVKTFLMDQRVVAGIGNIYASEILYHAGVRPGRAAGRLRRREWERVVTAMRQVLEEAIACGGSSISDYRDGFERFGSYQHRHRVYDRAGKACHACGSPIRGGVLTGRSTYYCPACQR
jgi:formamidopyrimidine-DNA glycosylase